MLLTRRFLRTTILLVFYVSALVGIGLARAGIETTGLECGLCVLFLFASWKAHGYRLLFCAVILGLCCGVWRGAQYLNRLQVYDALFYHTISIHAVASEDATYGKTKQLSFAAHDLQLSDGSKLKGKLQAGGFGVNAVFQDDVVELSGKLYPSRGSYQARMSFAKITMISHHPSIVATIRRKFIVGTQNALPEPLAPFVMGLLIGQRATLPDTTKQDLQRVGLTHIIAVSGYNLTIILQASRKMLGKRSKRMNTMCSIIMIAVFLLLAGTSASIVRAAIVSTLSIAIGYYGRPAKPLNLLALTALITAWANPAYVWGDLGWYLSFLAFYGVMVLGPLIQKRWPGKWHNSLLVSVAVESLCAEIMTLPLILFIFGQFSKVNLLANVLVVSFVPLAMLLGVIAGLAGMFLSTLSGWLAWPAVVLLNYMLDTAHILAGVSGVFVQGIGFSLPMMIASYVGLLLLTIILFNKTKNVKSAKITDRKVLTMQGIAS